MGEQLVQMKADQGNAGYVTNTGTVALVKFEKKPRPGTDQPFVSQELKQFYFSGENDLMHILGSMQLLDIGPYHTLMWTCFGCDEYIRKTAEKEIIRDIHVYQTKNARSIIRTCRGTVLYANSDSVVSSFVHSLDGILAAKTILKEVEQFNDTVKTIRGGICVKSGMHRNSSTANRRHSLEHMILTVKDLVNEAQPQEICVCDNIVEENRNFTLIQNSFFVYPKQRIILEHTRKTCSFNRMMLLSDTRGI